MCHYFKFQLTARNRRAFFYPRYIRVLVSVSHIERKTHYTSENKESRLNRIYCLFKRISLKIRKLKNLNIFVP